MGYILEFDNIFVSFLTLFEVMTGDDWSEIMEQAAEATGVEAYFFFIAFMLLGRAPGHRIG